jgi:6-phosphofructokinase 1
MSLPPPVLGIICGGGPAPGVNGVIASATFYARRLAWTVLGFHEGFRHLSTGDPSVVEQHTIKITQDFASRFYRSGGSIIRTDRSDPTRSPQKISNVLAMLSHFQVRYLLIIEGNDKVSSAHFVTRGVDPAAMQVMVIPKTIDNDILLPPGQCTLGFRTAVEFASELARNLARDAESGGGFFVLQTMGLHSGSLALAVAEAVGAQLAMVREDFGARKIELGDLCDVLEGCVVKRIAEGRGFGLCVISEGLVDQLSSRSVRFLLSNGDAAYGSEGRIVLEDANLARALAREVNRRLAEREIGVRVIGKKIGYELRSEPPNAADAIYAQELGYAAVEGFRLKHSNCMLVVQDGQVAYRSFRSLMDASGRIMPRKVDVGSQAYRVTREYFTRLTASDFAAQESVDRLAEAAGLSAKEFVARFERAPALTPK